MVHIISCGGQKSESLLPHTHAVRLSHAERRWISGFTLLELMIVVLIIGLLATLSVPAFMRARDRSRTATCINNLRHVESAKEQYAMEEGLRTGDSVTGINWSDYIKQGLPSCPIKNTAYTINGVGTPPTCANYDASQHPATLH